METIKNIRKKSFLAVNKLIKVLTDFQDSKSAPTPTKFIQNKTCETENKSNRISSKIRMKIKFYVLHWDSSLYTCFIVSKDNRMNTCLSANKTTKVLATNSRNHRANSYGFYLFLNEIECCSNFASTVASKVKSSPGPFVIQLIPNKCEFIDKTW